MPFGGGKGSGIGRFGGKAGAAEFTELHWVTIQTTPRGAIRFDGRPHRKQKSGGDNCLRTASGCQPPGGEQHLINNRLQASLLFLIGKLAVCIESPGRAAQRESFRRDPALKVKQQGCQMHL